MSRSSNEIGKRRKTKLLPAADAHVWISQKSRKPWALAKFCRTVLMLRLNLELRSMTLLQLAFQRMSDQNCQEYFFLQFWTIWSTHTHTHTHTHSLSLSHNHSHSLSHTRTHKLSHTHTHTHFLSQIYNHTVLYACMHTHTHTHTYTHQSPVLQWQTAHLGTGGGNKCVENYSVMWTHSAIYLAS